MSAETVSLDAENFSIKTDVFEGPLELLLELVEKRKLLINDISLASVTDEYMREVAKMQEQSLSHTAQFVQLAATLLLIKSKSLLPVLTLTDDEEEAIEDLAARLKLYQIYRDGAKGIEELFGNTLMHERQFVASSEPLFTTDAYTTIDALQVAMTGIISNLPVKEVKPKVQVRPVISLEQMIDRLHKRIETARSTTLRELLQGEQEPKTVIVGFLAILESVKQGSILVAQLNRFEDISVEREGMQAPKYY